MASPSPSQTELFKRCLVVALAYLATGWLGLQLPYVGPHVTLIWLPTGIATAAFLRWGGAVWPGVYLGAVLTNLSVGASLPLALGVSVGNTLGPLVAKHWLDHFGFQSDFSRRRDVGLLVAAAALGMSVAALGGAGNLFLAGRIPAAAAPGVALIWWMGDTAGVLLAAPLILSFAQRHRVTIGGTKEFLLLSLMGFGSAWFAFVKDYSELGHPLPLAFLTLPTLAWAALRFGVFGAAAAALGYAVIAAWGTGTHHGTFQMPDAHIGMLLLWSYVVTCTLTGLLLSALLNERIKVEDTLRESKQKLSGLFELSPLGIALTDMQGRYVEFNPAFERICGYSRDELSALDYWALTPKEYADQEAEQLDAIRTRGAYGPYEKEYIRKDGSRVPLQLNGVLIRGGDDQPYLWSIVEDITERKRVEEELDRHRHRLEEVVQQRTQELTQATLAAASASVAKSAFLANMSHEIRTPLNAITGLVQLIQRSGVSPQQADRLAKVETAGQHLLAIINAILDLSKIEAGKLTLEDAPLDVGTIVRDVASLLAQSAQAKGLQLIVDTEMRPGALLGDPTRVHQVLLNYGANAVKFTPSGTVTLRTRVVEERSDGVVIRFEVVDTGIGIAPESVGKLFSAFEQADNSITREYGGTGLGLAINKRLAQLMGGEVGVLSTPGGGSTFWFTARLKRGASTSQGAQGDRADAAEAILMQEHAGLRILLVEDEPINREVAMSFLSAIHPVIDVAVDGIKAVELARENSYDLILMDMQMPRMDGLEATQCIRLLPGARNVPIIAMTANAFAEDKKRCLDAGMNDVITKPFYPDVFFSTILRCLPK